MAMTHTKNPYSSLEMALLQGPGSSNKSKVPGPKLEAFSSEKVGKRSQDASCAWLETSLAVGALESWDAEAEGKLQTSPSPIPLPQ